MTTKKKSVNKNTVPKSQLELKLSFPLEKDWNALIERFKLSDVQANNLTIILQQIINDFDHFRNTMTKMPERSQLVTRLKRIEKILGTLSLELKRAEQELSHLLPHDIGSFIGKSMTFTALGDALGKDQFPMSVDLEIERMIAAINKVGQKTIDKFGEPRREALGIANSHILVPYLVEGIHKPMRLWVELDRKNKGGRTPNLLRRYLAYWLIYDAENIFGRKPTVSQLGKFVEFAEAIFSACRLPTLGLDKILPGIVKQVREDKKLYGDQIRTQEFKLHIFVEEPK